MDSSADVLNRRDVLRVAGGTIAGATTLVASGEFPGAARATQTAGGEVEVVDADPAAGFEYPYVLYRPATQRTTARPLFVVPHNSPAAETRDELVAQLTQRAEAYLQAAMSLSLPGLVAGFPRTPADGGDYVQSLALEMLDTESKRADVATDAFPAETLHRVDRQLLNMVDDAMARLDDEPYSVTDGIHMDGFSSSGSFSSRFTFLHPDRVDAISVGGGGARPLPQNSYDGVTLPYPLGTADYREWVGRSFDRNTWTDVDQYIYVGEEDQPLPETDRTGYYPISPRYQESAEAVYGQNRVTERFPVTRAVYEAADAMATFRIYQGVGHRVTPEIGSDIVQFQRQTSDAQHAIFDMTFRRSADQVAVGRPVTVTVQVQSRVSETVTVTPTFAVDGTDVETAEQELGPDGSTEFTFEHTFDDTGSYALSVDGQQVGDGPVMVTESTPTGGASDTEPTDTVVATTSEDGPGFGIGAAVAGFAGLSYLLGQRNGE